MAALVKDGPLAASRISYRMPYIQALVSGKTGAEVSKELGGEVDGLWAEVLRLVASATKAEVVPLRGRK